MINEENARRYCGENISDIENYELAIADQTQVWHCHHRLETDKCISKDELITLGLYYDRPASELIFLTEHEHRKIHFLGNSYRLGFDSPMKGKKHTDKARAKMSEKAKGRESWNKGKSGCYTEEQLKKMSESHKGQVAWNKGLHGVQVAWNKGKQGCYSEETRKRISESKKGQGSGAYNPAARRVEQIDLKTNKVIKIWDCIKDAAAFLNINRTAIVQCCRGRVKTSAGFGWRYHQPAS